MTKAKKLHLEELLKEVSERVFDVERQFAVADDVRAELYRARMSIGFARTVIRERPAAEEPST